MQYFFYRAYLRQKDAICFLILAIFIFTMITHSCSVEAAPLHRQLTHWPGKWLFFVKILGMFHKVHAFDLKSCLTSKRPSLHQSSSVPLINCGNGEDGDNHNQRWWHTTRVPANEKKLTPLCFSACSPHECHQPQSASGQSHLKEFLMRPVRRKYSTTKI